MSDEVDALLNFLIEQQREEERRHKQDVEQYYQRMMDEAQRIYSELYGGGRLWERAAQCGEDLDYERDFAEHVEEESLGQGRTVNPMRSK